MAIATKHQQLQAITVRSGEARHQTSIFLPPPLPTLRCSPLLPSCLSVPVHRAASTERVVRPGPTGPALATYMAGWGKRDGEGEGGNPHPPPHPTPSPIRQTHRVDTFNTGWVWGNPTHIIPPPSIKKKAT